MDRERPIASPFQFFGFGAKGKVLSQIQRALKFLIELYVAALCASVFIALPFDSNNVLSTVARAE